MRSVEDAKTLHVGNAMIAVNDVNGGLTIANSHLYVSSRGHAVIGNRWVSTKQRTALVSLAGLFELQSLVVVQ